MFLHAVESSTHKAVRAKLGVLSNKYKKHQNRNIKLTGKGINIQEAFSEERKVKYSNQFKLAFSNLYLHKLIINFAL